jgi:hypothetical protein
MSGMRLRGRMGRGIYKVGKVVHNVCQTFGPYLAVQKLVNKRSNGPPTKCSVDY